MQIYVVRHGQTDSNKNGLIMGQRIDESLNEEGIRQASVLSENLEKEGFDVIFSSPLKRALQTAETISKKFNTPMLIYERLLERDFGSLSGKTWEQIEEILQKDAHAKDRAQTYDYHSFGGETASDVKERVLSFLDFVKKEYGSKKVLVVSHGGILKRLQSLYKEEDIFTPENGSLHVFDI